ncbi:hypothetical protein G9A89_006974 [Geosiphon pyriformis]|nr:hypothetical protein G9A89_006974 [Geosiphon pyriformis]
MVNFLINAWSAVTTTTIQNCWRHMGILNNSQMSAHPLDIEQELLQEVQVLIEHVNIDKLLAIDFININKFEPLFTYALENEIVDLINNKYSENSNTNEDLESENESLPLLSTHQNKIALEDTLHYCEEQYSEKVDSDLFKTLRTLIHNTVLKVQEEKKQTSTNNNHLKVAELENIEANHLEFAKSLEINQTIERYTQQQFPITYADKGKGRLQTPAVTPKQIQLPTWKKIRVELPTNPSYHYILRSAINISLLGMSTSHATSTFKQLPFQSKQKKAELLGTYNDYFERFKS